MFIKRIELRELRMQLLHPFETSFGVTTERRIVLLTVTDGTHMGFWRSHRGRRAVLLPRDDRKQHGTSCGISSFPMPPVRRF